MPKHCEHCRQSQRLIEMHAFNKQVLKHVTCAACLKFIKMYQSQLTLKSSGSFSDDNPVSPPCTRDSNHVYDVIHTSHEKLPEPLSLQQKMHGTTNKTVSPRNPLVCAGSPNTLRRNSVLTSSSDFSPRSPLASPKSQPMSTQSSPRSPSTFISSIGSRLKRRSSVPNSNVGMAKRRSSCSGMHDKRVSKKSPIECLICSNFICQLLLS